MKNINPQDAATTKHLYEIEVFVAVGDAPLAGRSHVQVNANSRTQAAKIAKDAGYVVASVNMVG